MKLMHTLDGAGADPGGTIRRDRDAGRQAGRVDPVRGCRASPGDTVQVLPGTYRETVFIDKNDIRLQGVVEDGRWAVMDGESKLNDGILASGHGVIIERMWVRRYKGNGIMTQGANNYQIIDNVVEGPCFYAIFPQFGKNGLVARNLVTKSDDAAIYVGMSDGVDVLYNETSDSIIGIETENSRNQLIEGNYVHDNVIGNSDYDAAGSAGEDGGDTHHPAQLRRAQQYREFRAARRDNGRRPERRRHPRAGDGHHRGRGEH